MPYYIWSGIDLNGSLQRGKQFARSVSDLQQLLLKSEIGLIAARQQRFIFLRKAGVPVALKMEIMAHLATLLKAHIQVYQALLIISATVRHEYSKYVLQDMAAALAEGARLHETIALHNLFFDPLTRALVAAGEKTGEIAQACALLVEHNSVMAQLRRAVRSSLMIPGLTFCFFILVMLAVFLVVIPRFESFFMGAQQPLPYATEVILSISRVARSWSLVGFISALCVGYIARGALQSTRMGKRVCSYLASRMPVIGPLYISIQKTYFLQVMALALTGRIHLVEALRLAEQVSVSNSMRGELQQLIYKVESGTALSQALHESALFACYELEALVYVGESSGNLSAMIEQASNLYQQRIYTRLRRLTFVLQPIVLVMLGFCIGGLLYALYMPLFTLSLVIA